MHNQLSLIDDFFLSPEVRNSTTLDKYEYLNNLYRQGHTYILLNNIRVFGPYPRPNVPWDISEAQKVATYDPEVTKVLSWVNANIIINLARIDLKTMGVLIRIATGMLNKCNIPKGLQITFHDNMVENLRVEHAEVIMSGLPF